MLSLSLPEYPSVFLKAIYYQWASEKFCDLKFVVADQEYSLQRNIICAISPKIADLLETPGPRNANVKTPKLLLNGVKKPIFEHVLKFIYSGVLQCEPLELIDIWHVSVYLQLTALQTVCEHNISSRWPSENPLANNRPPITLKLVLSGITTEKPRARVHSIAVQTTGPKARVLKQKPPPSARLLPQRFECEQCSRKFLKKKHLNHHKCTGREYCAKKYQTKNQNPAAKLQCIKCSRWFSSKRFLATHLARHATSKKFSSIVFQDLEECLKHCSCFVCELCNEKLLTSVELKLHRRFEHSPDEVAASDVQIICNFCEIKFTKMEYHTQHVLTRHFQPLCSQCNSSFPNYKVFKVHMHGEHNDDTPFRCPRIGCEAAFDSARGLYTHFATHSRRQIICPHCNKVFNQYRNMSQHVRHCLQIKRHLCDICGRGFVELGDLKKHKRVHLDEKPYFCPQCGMRFRENSNLRKHLRKHGFFKEPNVCKSCGQQFKNFNTLKVHWARMHADRPPDAEKNVAPEEELQSCSAVPIPIQNTLIDVVRCTICNELFDNIDVLMAHTIAHPDSVKDAAVAAGASGPQANMPVTCSTPVMAPNSQPVTALSLGMPVAQLPRTVPGMNKNKPNSSSTSKRARKQRTTSKTQSQAGTSDSTNDTAPTAGLVSVASLEGVGLPTNLAVNSAWPSAAAQTQQGIVFQVSPATNVREAHFQQLTHHQTIASNALIPATTTSASTDAVRLQPRSGDQQSSSLGHNFTRHPTTTAPESGFVPLTGQTAVASQVASQAGPGPAHQPLIYFPSGSTLSLPNTAPQTNNGQNQAPAAVYNIPPAHQIWENFFAAGNLPVREQLIPSVPSFQANPSLSLPVQIAAFRPPHMQPTTVSAHRTGPGESTQITAVPLSSALETLYSGPQPPTSAVNQTISSLMMMPHNAAA